MYLKINDTDKSLISFSQTRDKIMFVFAEDISSEGFADISVVKLYSDDNMFLTEYTLDEYKLECNGNELYLKDKNEVIDLDALKVDKITESKMMLAEWLETHPYQYTDGKYYSCTEEKQALLNGNLASYERATQAGIPYPLKWNSTGDECLDWSYEDLVTLSLSIAGYVAPKVSMQQAYELQIKACGTVEEVNEIVISYD